MKLHYTLHYTTVHYVELMSERRSRTDSSSCCSSCGPVHVCSATRTSCGSSFPGVFSRSPGARASPTPTPPLANSAFASASASATQRVDLTYFPLLSFSFSFPLSFIISTSNNFYCILLVLYDRTSTSTLNYEY